MIPNKKVQNTYKIIYVGQKNPVYLHINIKKYTENNLKGYS